jgi:hypothetical protein
MVFVATTKFTMPPKLLEQINECSSGGYILFTFDEQGLLQVNSKFDGPVHAVAMHSHISTWARAIEDINLDISANNILKNGFTKKRKK